ncbi:hypothetical protein D3C74_431930 [compost metagenome]
MSDLDNQFSLPAIKRRITSNSYNRRTTSLRLQRMKENVLAYGFLAPSLLLFAVFLFYPMFKSVYLSLHSTVPT